MSHTLTNRAHIGNAPTRRISHATRAAIGAPMGGLLEIYDLIAYGIFAMPIFKTFFATSSDIAACMLTFATFGVDVIARPIAALLIGTYSDRVGRKTEKKTALLACYASCASGVLGELSSTPFRVTDVAISYAIGVMLFGGFTPAIITWMIAVSGDKQAIAHYLISAVVLSCIPVLFVRATRL